jgi:DNA-binding protein HU-beta
VNKSELIDDLASRLSIGKSQAQQTLDEVLDAITRAVVAGEKVAITGFGIFEKVERGARTARNPRTGATVKVKKTSVAKFRPGADLKAFVSGAKKLPRQAAAAATKAAAPARSTAKKAPARKTATKAAPAKRTATKRTATKAAPARRTTAKKAAPVKRTTAKRTTAKKAPARRTSR